jgi:hypothetical protein
MEMEMVVKYLKKKMVDVALTVGRVMSLGCGKFNSRITHRAWRIAYDGANFMRLAELGS